MKLMTSIFISATFVLTSCFESHVSYEIKTGDRINDEIVNVDCHVSRAGDELYLEIAKCDSYGTDKCKGIKIIDGTLDVMPYFEKTMDTLKLTEIKEGTRFYKCENFGQVWRSNDKLVVHLTYKVDSFNVVYGKDLFLTLDRDETYQFSVY